MTGSQLFYLVLFLPLYLVLADNEIETLKLLRDAYPDWEARGIIDVGANRGMWSRQAVKVYPNAKVFMVEAFPQHEEELKKAVNEIGSSQAEYRIGVMSKQDGEIVKFYTSNNDLHFTTGNSMFVENSQHYSNSDFTERSTLTLDTLVSQTDIGTVADYLKLDVQGAEMVVLQGAHNILQQVTFVQLEVSLVQYNQGGACWWEIDALLRSYGFYAYDVQDLIRNPGAFHTKGVGQMEVLYVRQASKRLPKWLEENHINMCGSSRIDTIGQHHVFGNSIRGAAETAAAVSVNNYFDVSILTFLLGLIVGKLSGRIVPATYHLANKKFHGKLNFR
jgi:FkbM family methyltransferase